MAHNTKPVLSIEERNTNDIRWFHVEIQEANGKRSEAKIRYIYQVVTFAKFLKLTTYIHSSMQSGVLTEELKKAGVKALELGSEKSAS